MCRKSFTVATFVRHSIPRVPEHYYSFPTDIIKNQIATGKGFFAYTPASPAVFGFIAFRYYTDANSAFKWVCCICACRPFI